MDLQDELQEPFTKDIQTISIMIKDVDGRRGQDLRRQKNLHMKW